MASDAYRLPRHLRPVRYDLALTPDIGSARFDGHVDAQFTVEEPTDQIVLNAAELRIGTIEVRVDGHEQTVTSLTIDDELERLTIQLAETVESGTLVAAIDFEGVLNDQLRGFYRSTYTDDDGVEHTIAITQFESTNARRAFPCVDEPDAKAVFGVTLTTDPGLTALSCTRPTSTTTLDDGRVRTEFADTISMSTYIVAFVVGELEATEPVMVGDTAIRVVHPPGKGHLTDFAVEAGAFSLDWLERYFESDYPGDKLDLVAAPDFAFGAMENMGCVTFRETLLLADPATATTNELMRMSDVIAHEIAHMWFGNLVTMEWWEGIWLKEAFATFMEVATTDAFKPEWRRWDQFSRDRAPAFAVDSLASTRKVEFPVHSPDDAEAMYDVITYEKGAALVRMLEQFLGEEQFRDGVRHYLSTHSLGNTVTTDLWDAIETATGSPVRAMMDTWIYRAGHPIITVEATDAGIKLRQRIFRFDNTGDTEWHVPISLRAKVDGEVVEHRLILESTEAVVELGGRPEWVVANDGAHGFYRVNYRGELHDALVTQAQEVLSATERAALVDDLVASVISGDADAYSIMVLAEEFAYETDLGVWRSIGAGLGLLDRLVDDETLPRFRQRVARLTTTALDILGTETAEGEDPLTRELRGLLFRLAGAQGAVPRVIDLADELFDRGPNGVDPALFAAAIAVVAEHGDDARYDDVVRRVANAGTPQEELRYLMSLPAFPTAEQMARTLEACRTTIRTQNAPYILATAIAHREHGPMAWNFVRTHWDELAERFPNNSIPRMVSGITAIVDDATAHDISGFLAEHPVPQGGATIDQHLERMRINLAARTRESARLATQI